MSVLYHLFVYQDDREGGQIGDFRGADDTLEQVEQLLKVRQYGDDYAYVAKFDDEKRTWEVLRYYNFTMYNLIDGQEERYIHGTDYSNRVHRWIYSDNPYPGGFTPGRWSELELGGITSLPSFSVGS